MDDKINKIFFYDREFYPLSNFASFMVEYDGYLWPTSEYAYQAQKFTDINIVNEIKNEKSSHEVFGLGLKYKDKIRPYWFEIRVSVMEKILRAKMEQHEYVRRKLLETGDKEIIENSPVDSFWGWGPNKDGENQLGKIWMKLREELKNK